MQKNLSPFDRLVRFLLSLLTCVIAIELWPVNAAFGAVFSVCALFLLLNALLGRCYLWRWLGIDTARNCFNVRNRQN